MHKNRHIKLVIIIMGAFLLSACSITGLNVTRGSGEITTQIRSVSEFDAIQINGAGELIISQGNSESLEIQAEDNIIEELTSDVQGSTLILGFRDNFLRRQIIPTERITYNLEVVDLSEVTINGAADMDIKSLETGSLALIINGAGNITVNQLISDRLTVEISGTATIEVEGQVSQQFVTIEGAGNFKAGDLQTSSTSIEITGVGNATVWATENLDISIDGGGNLRYYGSPNITKDINGLGDIDNLGEK